ncbi:unnamed protein product [Zymoseptoria tritici ST99CH_1A5]|uniref:Uncharacterized protein n=1 Tax=Zymoseptoria tritici ST99CH_1A5 TaxID=1276529 RepID=A0A1Y6LVV9_ZYMTR|nr:unnamed protein product [Zymoseptoria tritici ST99CH_1A5]
MRWSSTPSTPLSATNYCSSLLAIKPRTVTNTVLQTTSAPSVITITAPARTELRFNTLTNTNTETVTATASTISSSAISTSTITAGITQVKAPASLVAYDTKQNLYDEHLQCPTAREQRLTSTTTKSVISVSTITSTSTKTPMIYITATTYITVAVTATNTITTGYVSTSTTTATIPSSTSIVSNNLCTGPESRGNFFLYSEYHGVEVIQVALGDFPAVQPADYGGNFSIIKSVQINGLLYLTGISDSTSTTGARYPTIAPGSIALYVPDGTTGGSAYYGDIDYVLTNKFFQPPCTFVGDHVRCHNVDGQAFRWGETKRQ